MPRARTAIAASWIAGLAGAVLAPVAEAQSPTASRPLAQSAPSGDSVALNAALARLARNPRDTAALIDAGTAALATGDADAAIGFFTRAEQVQPGNARAKAGLAGAHVRNEDPFTAIRLFAEAEQAGPLSSSLVADRGLAYDLVGDNVTAQRYYRLAGPANDEALRRLSLSLAIAGDKRGSESALSPLLTRQDKSAWRVRAFSLAILGDTEQAVSIANAMMPAGLAAGIAPYLRYMRQLTPAQQAAAANLGHFPRASEIGRDDPRIAQYSRPVARAAQTGPDAGLIPAGEPLGKREAERLARQDRERQRDRDRERSRQASRQRERPPEPIVATITTTPAPSVAPRVAAIARPAPPIAVATSRPSASPPPASPPPVAPNAPVVVARLPEPVPAGLAPTPAAPRPVQGPSFDLLPASGRAPVLAPAPAAVPVQAAPALAPAATPAAPPSAPRSLAEVFSEFARPTISTTPAPGSVDVRRIAPTRPAAPKEVKPAVPAQPSRIWVQVATGRDKRALAFDWRKMSREHAALFRSRKPYVADWGQTNRLLAGPFESEAVAGEFINKLRKAEVAGAFLWTSPAGQVVDDLSLGK